MTPSEDMFLPENAEKLRRLMERYDKMAEDAIREDEKMRKAIFKNTQKAKKD